MSLLDNDVEHLSKVRKALQSDTVDQYGFFALHEADGDVGGALHNDPTTSASSLSSSWMTEALRKEESWWASDFLLYLSWKSALGTVANPAAAAADSAADPVARTCESGGGGGDWVTVGEATTLDALHVTMEETPPHSPPSVALVGSSSARNASRRGSRGDLSAPIFVHRHPLSSSPPPPHRGADTAWMVRWFWGRWVARLRQYGGCPHMSLRALLWGFFSGAWQQTVDQQESEMTQYVAAAEAEPGGVHADHAAALEAIDRDIGRTLPHHILFQSVSPLSTGQQQLRRLLRAYAARDPEVGYCQGMAFAAAVVLMVAPERQAFHIFCGLMRDGDPSTAAQQLGGRHGMRQLYRSGFPLLQTLLIELESHVQLLLPALAAHLRSSDVQISMFASQWFLTLFAHQLPPPLLLRVWDFFLVRGWSVMVQVAVALLHQEQGALLKLDLEGILLHLKVVRSRRRSEGELLRRVCNVPLL
jgi:hypothetical protein